MKATGAYRRVMYACFFCFLHRPKDLPGGLCGESDEQPPTRVGNGVSGFNMQFDTAGWTSVTTMGYRCAVPDREASRYTDWKAFEAA